MAITKEQITKQLIGQRLYVKFQDDDEKALNFRVVDVQDADPRTIATGAYDFILLGQFFERDGTMQTTSERNNIQRLPVGYGEYDIITILGLAETA